MNGKINTLRTVCKAIVAVAIAAAIVAAIFGCRFAGGSAQSQHIVAAIQTAYS